MRQSASHPRYECEWYLRPSRRGKCGPHRMCLRSRYRRTPCPPRTRGLVPDRDLRRQPNLLLKFRAKGLPPSPQIICAWKSPSPKHPLITIGGHHAEHPDVVLKGDAMTSRGDCPIPSTSSHTIRTTEVCSLSQRKNSPGSPNVSRSRRRGLLLPCLFSSDVYSSTKCLIIRR